LSSESSNLSIQLTPKSDDNRSEINTPETSVSMMLSISTAEGRFFLPAITAGTSLIVCLVLGIGLIVNYVKGVYNY
jgi:hypothetical protein